MTDDEFRELANDQYGVGGDLEFDELAVVSRGSDHGAYVQCWKWVDDPENVPSANEANDFASKLYTTSMTQQLYDKLKEIVSGAELEGVTFVPGYWKAKELLKELE
jgi:hypothetical protein